MKIITLNTNGIRSAAEKGFFQWMQSESPDIVCLQETRAQEHQLDNNIINLPGYHHYFFDAEQKGYSGVGIYCKKTPKAVMRGLGFAVADTQGRYLQIDYDNISIASIYLPSGSSGPEKQANKFEFMQHFINFLKKIRRKRREFIFCGDWNIAHQKIDLKNWRANQQNSGFLPEEREWMDQVLGPIGYVDAFRQLNRESDQYTWWSNRGRAYEKNVGWRIDYQIISPGLRFSIKKVSIYKDQRFSDHAPLIIDYDLVL